MENWATIIRDSSSSFDLRIRPLCIMKHVGAQGTNFQIPKRGPPFLCRERQRVGVMYSRTNALTYQPCLVPPLSLIDHAYALLIWGFPLHVRERILPQRC